MITRGHELLHDLFEIHNFVERLHGLAINYFEVTILEKPNTYSSSSLFLAYSSFFFILSYAILYYFEYLGENFYKKLTDVEPNFCLSMRLASIGLKCKNPMLISSSLFLFISNSSKRLLNVILLMFIF